MDCARTEQLIECYADGELDAISSSELEKHLSGCPVCSRSLEHLQSFRELIRETLPRPTVPARLAKRVRNAAYRSTGAAQRISSEWLKWLKPAALVAVTAVVTWTAASRLQEAPNKQTLAEEAISSHARATLTGHLEDMASSERHTVKPWLSSKLDFSPPVPDLATAGFPLTGARVDYLDGRSVAVLVYKRRQHVIDLFVWPENNARPVKKADTLSRKGYQAINWADGVMTYWAVSDLNAPELKAFAENFSSSK